MTITRASFACSKSQPLKFAQSVMPSYMQTVGCGPRRWWLQNVHSDWSVARMTCRTMSGGAGSGAGSRASLIKVKISGSYQRGSRMSTTRESDHGLRSAQQGKEGSSRCHRHRLRSPENDKKRERRWWQRHWQHASRSMEVTSRVLMRG